MNVKTAFVSLLVNFVVVTAILTVFNLIRNGEPRVLHGMLMGLSLGVTITAVLHWRAKRKSDAKDSE